MPYSIMLVDDDHFILDTLGPALESEGYSVSTTDNGEDAIKMITSEKFDLVITDLVMEPVDGFTILKSVKNLTHNIMVIIITGHCDTASVIDALRIDVDDYLLKPCELDEITFRVSKCIEKLESKKKMKQAEYALAKSEEKFRTIADYTYDWVTWKSPEGKYLYVSPACERITGYTQSDFYNNPDLLVEIMFLDDYLNFSDHLKEHMHQGEANAIDFKIISRDDEERWISHVCQPVFDSNNNFLGRRASNRDITERKKVEEELIKAKKLEATGVLAGGIAHDFNNLLSVILGNTSLIQEDMKHEYRISEFLSEIEESALKAKDLTKKFLTFSSGGTPIIGTGSIEELLMDTVKMALSGSNLDCRFDFDENLLLADMDKRQIGQVFYNIIENSKQAAPDGGIIEIKAENIEDISKTEAKNKVGKFGRYMKVSIKDHGTGIDKKYLSSIFDPYFSLKTKSAEKGTGLGLSIAYSIIKKHNGYIHAKSEVGKGTEIILYLPASDQQDTKLKKEIQQKTGADFKKILLMDDEKSSRALFSMMLQRLGYDDVELAAHGDEVIESFVLAKETGQPFDLVILDLTVKGGMGGKGTIKRLKEIDPGIKAVVISGYSSDPAMTAFEQFGFCASIAKPFTKEQLQNTLDNISVP